MTVALVTDSSSQIPPALAARLGVTVVPIPVRVDGREYREGVDLDADAFYRLLDEGAATVTTSQPSPGAIGEVYAALAAGGADEVVCVHVGSEVSGTVNAARLAAAEAPVPVRVVDSGTASFGVTCCVWAAADALAAGGGAADAEAAVDALRPDVATAFVVQADELVRRSGRLDVELPDAPGALPVLAGRGVALDVVGEATSVDSACRLMAEWMGAAGPRLRAAVGEAGPGTAPFADGLEARLRRDPAVVEVVRYRVGPSVAAHVGPGTAGGFVWPAPALPTG